MSTSDTMTHVRKSLIEQNQNNRCLVYHKKLCENIELVSYLHRTIVSDDQHHFSILDLLMNMPEGSKEREARRSDVENSIKEHFKIFFNTLNIFTDCKINCIFYDGKFMMDDRISLCFTGWTNKESINRLKLKDFKSYEFLYAIGMTIQNENK